MTSSITSLNGAEPASTERHTFGNGLRAVVVCSLSVTALAALAAIGVAVIADIRWSLAFVVLRWLVVAALLALPLVHQLAVRLHIRFELPWVLRTPATGLLLTCESICFDIVSAQLR